MQIRVVHDTGIMLHNYTHTATGATDDVSTTVVIPVGLATGNICIDYVYNPSVTIAGADNWKAGRFFCNPGPMPKPYESLGYNETLGLLAGRYSTGKVYAYGTDIATAAFSFETLSDMKTAADVTVLASDSQGAALNTPGGVVGTVSPMQYSAHSLVRNFETV